MAQKRFASSELNHDNWDIEEEAETSGVFRTASSTILAGRQIKQATRRLKKSSASKSVSEQGRAFPIFQALNFASAAAASGNNQASFFTTLTSPVVSNKNLLNTKEPTNSAKAQKTESSVLKHEALPSMTNSLSPSITNSLSPSTTNSLSTIDSDKEGFGTSGTWSLKSTRPFSAFAFGFPTASQTKSDADANKPPTDKSISSSTNSSKWKPVSSKPSTDGSSKPHSFITIPSTSVLASPSPTTAKPTNDAVKLPPMTSNFSASDNNKLPSFTAKAFASYTSHNTGTSKLTATNTSKLTLVTAQPEQKVPEWSSPLKCCLDTRSVSSTSTSALPAFEILSKIDSRHLLKPVPGEILKRLQTKCVASGKSLNFLKRTYQLNVTTLDWLKLLVQEDLTVNIAEVIPSYIQELLKLIDEEVASQKSETVGVDLTPHQTILKQMLEVFREVGLGVEDGCASASTISTLPESNKIEKTVKVPSPTKELKLNPVNRMESEKASTMDGKKESDLKAESTGSKESFVVQKNNVLKTVSETGEKQKIASEDDENEDAPPKVVFTPVVEEGSVCTMRCKVFIKKTDPETYDTSYVDHGVGMLYIKPLARGKAQLVVRADNSLGNLLLNVCITAEIPIEVANPTTVMLVCRPLLGDTEPKTVLLRVKTTDDCDLLHEKLIII